VFSLLETLEQRAELFVAVSDPTPAYWIESPGCRPFLRSLGLFRARQMMPLLFACWERFTRENFVSVLQIVTVITLRYSVVGGRNSNVLEPTYHRAARAVLDGEAGRPEQVFAVLRSLYPEDDQFRQDFRTLTGDTGVPRKKLLRYLLAELERDSSGKACDPDTDPFTLEHILPENPGEEWGEEFPTSHRDQYVYRLGNLTLLEAPANRRVKNAAYRDKLAAYGDSAYRLTRAIPELAPEEWTPARVDARQERLAARAVHVWRLDFS